MDEWKIKAYAKINLTLDVLGKRGDGYHELATIMQTIDLADLLSFREISQGIKIISTSSQIPTDEGNLAYQAAKLIIEGRKLAKGIEITLEKNIPVAAGLAGGSADAAATLRGLNHFWGLNLSPEELWELASKLGSDVAFCLQEGTCLATGRGEILQPLVSPPPLWLVLVKPPIAVSTAQVYHGLSLQQITVRPDNSAMVQALAEGNLEKIGGNLVNVLETVTLKMHPPLTAMKEQLKSLGALGVLMSGSGPTIFALASTRELAENIAQEMKQSLKEVFVTTTLGSCQEEWGERKEAEKWKKD